MSEAPDFLNMSDEDFQDQMPASGDAPVEGKPATTAEEVGTETEVLEPVVETDTEELAPVTTEAKPVTSRKKAPAVTVDETEVKPDATAKKPSTAVEPAEGEQTDTEATEGEVEAEATDYAAFYQKIMTPFKANGRTVELKTPEEAIQLMQMGANYTKKMQELVPQRKLLTMLTQNGLDEGKLSYLIDLDKKNPEAIKKLLKDSGVDPMEIDTSIEPAYREGNHRVSDEEVNFQQTLEDMQSTPERVATINTINGDWDQVSKEALWKNPEIMTIIHGQRETGVYDQIVTEVARRRTLGQIPNNIPFLQAYRTIGDEMTKANAFVGLAPKVAPSAVAQNVVATRVAAPKAVVKNNERAAAASTNRSTPQKGKGPVVNPLSMSDDDFLKQFDGRL